MLDREQVFKILAEEMDYAEQKHNTNNHDVHQGQGHWIYHIMRHVVDASDLQRVIELFPAYEWEGAKRQITEHLREIACLACRALQFFDDPEVHRGQHE